MICRLFKAAKHHMDKGRSGVQIFKPTVGGYLGRVS